MSREDVVAVAARLFAICPAFSIRKAVPASFHRVDGSHPLHWPAASAPEQQQHG